MSVINCNGDSEMTVLGDDGPGNPNGRPIERPFGRPIGRPIGRPGPSSAEVPGLRACRRHVQVESNTMLHSTNLGSK